MIYVVLALLIISAILAIVMSAKIAEVRILKSDKETLSTQVKELNLSIDRQKSNLDEETKRRERLISELRKEIESLEKDVAACSDPTVVRARLRKLFSSETGDSSSTR